MPITKKQFVHRLLADLVVEDVINIPGSTYEFNGGIHYYATYENKKVVVFHEVTLLKSVYVTSEGKTYEADDHYIQIVYEVSQGCGTLDNDRCDVLMTEAEYSAGAHKKIIYPPIPY